MTSPETIQKVKKRRKMQINPEALQTTVKSNPQRIKEIKAAYAPPHTLGDNKGEKATLAMDSGFLPNQSLVDFVGNAVSSFGLFGSAEFLGYASLANLMQDGILRLGADALADEMTRKWIEFAYVGEDDENKEDTEKKIKDIEAEFVRLEVRDRFRQCEFFNEFYGGCLLYMNTGETDDPEELSTPLVIDKAKITKGCLEELVVVEPVNVYPGIYNSNQPLKSDYFNPATWFVLGQEVHKSRLMKFEANEPPLLLKPAYNFFGIPPAQIVLDYVANFSGTRESAARLLQKFSLTYLKTNLESVLQGGGTEQLDLRAQLLARSRDNDSLVVVDNETEDVAQINTPLSGVVDIVRQTLEFVSAIWHIPVVKFLGISPGGFNSTGDSDFQSFYDHCGSLQEKRFRKNVQTVLDAVQLNLGYELDPNITFKFVPLKEMTAKEMAEIAELKSRVNTNYVNGGVLSQEEVRQVLANDPDSGFNSIDVSDVPESPDSYSPVEGEEESTEEEEGEEKGSARRKETEEKGAKTGRRRVGQKQTGNEWGNR